MRGKDEGSGLVSSRMLMPTHSRRVNSGRKWTGKERGKRKGVGVGGMGSVRGRGAEWEVRGIEY